MRIILHNDRAALKDFMRDLPAGIFAYSGTVMHEGVDNVKVLEHEGEKLVAVRFAKPAGFASVSSLLRGSAAKRAYFNGLKLRQNGIAAPRPLGFVEVGRNGSSYLVTEYAGYRPVSDLIDGAERGNEVLFNCFVRYTVTLHEKGVRHGAYTASNVLYRRRVDGRYDFMITGAEHVKFGSMGALRSIRSIRRVSTNTEFMLRFTKRYAELRNWNVYRSVSRLAAFSMAYRKHGNRQDIPDWARMPAEA